MTKFKDVPSRQKAKRRVMKAILNRLKVNRCDKVRN